MSTVFDVYQSTNEILISFLLSQIAQHFSARANTLKTIEPEWGNCQFIERGLNVKGYGKQQINEKVLSVAKCNFDDRAKNVPVKQT